MNLLGINGYIGSGKDTVGTIIQYLDSVNKGYNGTFSDWYVTSDRGLYPTDWQIKKFAAKLKQIASLLTGIPAEKFEDQEFKKTLLGEEWGRKEVNWNIANKIPGIPRPLMDVQMSVREFLQKLGTEAVRDGLHSNAWVNALFADYKETISKIERDKDVPFDVFSDTIPLVIETRYPKWLITDTRFPNEAQAIKDRGGIVVRVNRDAVIPGTFSINHLGWKIKEGAHPSETSLDDWKFDYVIENDGTIEELIEKVKQMLIKYEIIQTAGQGEALS